MTKIFVHALEGEPEDTTNFTGKTERDIRVSWLLTNDQGGKGPWAKKSANPQMIVLQRSGTGEQPRFIEEVHFPFIPDGNELADRLLLPVDDPRHVDFAPTLTDPDTIDRLLNEPEVNLVSIPGLNIFYLGLYMDQGPFADDRHLRKAVACAIDVPTHASTLGKKAADPAVGPVPPHMKGHDPNLHQERFDRKNAARYLRDSAYNTSQPLTLLYNGAATYTSRLARAIADDLTHPNIGLSVNLQGFQNWSEMLAAVRARQGHMFIYSWHQRNPRDSDPHEFLNALFRSSSPTNLTRYNGVDNLLNPGPSQDLQKAQQTIIGDSPMVFLSHWKRWAAYNRRVQNLQLDAGALPHRRLIDVS